MSMDRKQKHDLRIQVCLLMNAGRTDEARELMNKICGVERITDDPRTRHIRVTDKDGNTTEYPSINQCAKAFNVARSTVKAAIKIGTPVTGVFKGYALDADHILHETRPVRVSAVKDTGEIVRYGSVSEAMRATGISSATLNNSLDSDKPIGAGKFKGWKFERVGE